MAEKLASMGGPARYDVVVVGGGPAGMAAAATAVEARLTVALLDAGAGLGGQYWRHPAPALGSDPSGADQPADADTAGQHHDRSTFLHLRATILRARTAGSLALLLSHHVWTITNPSAPHPDSPSPEFLVRAVDRTHGPGGDVEQVVRAGRLILATGAYDRSLPFPGWDLPGVMTAGGLQALLKADAVAAGTRIAVGGTGPFLLPVASGLARHGAQVVGVFESGPLRTWSRYAPALLPNLGKLFEGAGYAATMARHRIPYRHSSMIVEAHGTRRVEAVTVGRLSASGRLQPGSRQRIAVDAVGVGWGFNPQLDLALALKCELSEQVDRTPVVAVDTRQRSSVAGVYVAGEVTGVGGAMLAVCEGRLAGASVVADAARESTDSQSAAEGPDRASQVLLKKRARLRAFADVLQRAHPVPAGWAEPLEPETIVCRCEEISYGAVCQIARQHAASDPRQLKQLSRVGMGWCQGRVCGFAAARLMAELSGQPIDTTAAPRPVAAPISLGALATDEAHPDRARS